MDWGSIPHDSNYMGMSMWWAHIGNGQRGFSKVGFEILYLNA
jgi:hypothetical protein